MKKNNLILLFVFMCLSCKNNQTTIDSTFVDIWENETKIFLDKLENKECSEVLRRKISGINSLDLRKKALDTILFDVRYFKTNKLIIEEFFYTNSARYVLTMYGDNQYKVFFEGDYITNLSKSKLDSKVFDKPVIEFDNICNDSLLYAKEKVSINISTVFVKSNNSFKIEKLDLY